MSVGLVIVTHGETGASLISEAEFILDKSMEDVQYVSFHQSGDERDQMVRIHAAITAADQGDGVLVAWTDPDRRTVWLAVHYPAEPEGVSG